MSVCPECEKEFLTRKTCPTCKVPLKQKGDPKAYRWRWYDAAVILLGIIVVSLVLAKVQIPYVIEEQYTVHERYVEEEPYTTTEPAVVQVPYNVTQLIVDYVPYTPEKTVTKDICYYKDVPYVVHYEPGLQNPFSYFTETGYRFNIGGVYGEYHQKVEICHSPLRVQNEESRFDAVFAICNYVGEKKDECPDKIITKYGDLAAGYFKQGSLESPEYQGVYSKNNNLICFRKINLVWKTPYDERKSIRLEPISLPQIRVCEKKEVTEKVNLYTEHGQIAKQPTKPVEREVIKTQYREETQMKEVTKTRQIEKFRDVPKVRYITKYRSLWEELRVTYGF